MHGMHRPDDSYQERNEPQVPASTLAHQRRKQTPQQQVKQKAAGAMKQHVGQMVAKRVSVPQPVIQHIRPVLNRPVVGGKGVKKEPVPKDFETEDRTPEEGILADKIGVIPDPLPSERRPIHQESRDKAQQERAQSRPRSWLASQGHLRAGGHPVPHLISPLPPGPSNCSQEPRRTPPSHSSEKSTSSFVK